MEELLRKDNSTRDDFDTISRLLSNMDTFERNREFRIYITNFIGCSPMVSDGKESYLSVRSLYSKHVINKRTLEIFFDIG